MENTFCQGSFIQYFNFFFVVPDAVTLHNFPNPNKDAERFRTWLYTIGGNILNLDNNKILKCRSVCHNHFEKKYHTWTNRLSANAVPTLNLPGKVT